MATVIDSLMISIGVDPQKAREGFAQIQQAAQKTDSEFTNLAAKWKGVITGLVSTVIAPVAGAFAIGKVVNSYMSDVSSVAKLTGAYSEKLEEWRLKRAQLARVTKEDIALYKKSREALTSFKIAFGDVSAKMMRSFMPAMQFGIDVLNKFTEWINRNQDNIVRFFQVTAGVITAVFLPAIIKTSAAMLASPLTWIVAALGALVLVIDDLVTYMQGGKTALSGFWSYFGSGPEIMENLNKAFTVFKEIVSVLWKPLAAIAAGFAAFKIGSVLVQGFISVLSGLKAALTLISAHPIMAMLMGLISLVMWVSDAFSRAGGDWTKVLDLMKADLKGFLNLFGGLGDILANFFAPIEGIFDSFINMMGNALGAVMNVFKLIWAYITGASDEAKDKIAAALWGCIDGVIQNLTAYVTQIWDLIGASFNNMLALIGNAFRALPTAIGAVFDGVVNVVTGIADFLGSAFGQLFDLLGTGFSALGSAMAAPFVALYDSAVNTLASIGEGATALCDGVVSGIAGVASSIGDAIGAAISYVTDGVASVVTGIKTSIGAALTFIQSTVSNAVGYVANAVTGAAMSAYSAITGALTSVGSFVSGVLAKISKAAASLWKSITSAAKAVGLALMGIWDGFKQAFESICKAVGSAWDSVINGIKSIVESVISFITGLWADAKTAAMAAFEALGAAVESVCTSIRAFFGDAIDSVLELFRSIPAIVSGVFEQVVTSIKDAFSEALDAASEFFDAVIAFFARIPQMIAQAFDIGGMIDGATAKLKGALGDTWDGVKGAFGFGGKDDKGADGNAPAVSTSQPIQWDAIKENLSVETAAIPVAANTSSIVNNTNAVDNRRSNSAKTSNTNITINTNSDRPAAIARAVQGALPDDEIVGSDYVMAADTGNFNY